MWKVIIAEGMSSLAAEREVPVFGEEVMVEATAEEPYGEVPEETSAVEGHVLPPGDRGVGVLSGVVAPTAPALALGSKGIGYRSLRRFAQAFVLADAVGFTQGN